MNQITNPYGKMMALVNLCLDKLDIELNNVSKEQARLNDYKAKNPDKVLQINSWQESLNSRVDTIEYLAEAMQESFPALFEAEGQRRFLKGREFEKKADRPQSFTWFKNENQKEAFRHYSVAEQRLKDNI